MNIAKGRKCAQDRTTKKAKRNGIKGEKRAIFSVIRFIMCCNVIRIRFARGFNFEAGWNEKRFVDKHT